MGNVIKPTGDQLTELLESAEENCRLAAQAIAEADFLLFNTGAGFSADSGLAVYKDVANIPPYQKRNLTYSDICQPQWLQEEPELFFGFWGMCFNDYRNTTPHDGYAIIKNWKDSMFPQNDAFKARFVAQGGDDAWRQRVRTKINKQLTLVQHEDLELHNIPGPFFHVTSNVDRHALTAGFKRTEFAEIHGNTETWQCGKKCTEKLWTATPDYRFTIDSTTMLTPKPEDISKAQTPDRHGFETTFPHCKFCNERARPAILMFCDDSCIDDDVPSEFYHTWESAVRKIIREDETKKVVILEIGCGNRVTTIRNMSERFFSGLELGQVTFVRVNPEFPLADRDLEGHKLIPIMSKGLAAVKKIDAYLQEIKAQKAAAPPAKKVPTEPKAPEPTKVGEPTHEEVDELADLLLAAVKI